jgi:predicted Zn-dependent peptidase
VAPVVPGTGPGAIADLDAGRAAVAQGSRHEMTEHRTTTLPSGVRVITERIENVRSVALGFWIGTGSAMESDAQAGTSHLLEHMLFRGTASYRSHEIDELFDAMGAELNAGTDRESTSLYTRVMDRHLQRAFDVASEMVLRPRFESLEAEREVVLEEIAMYEDDPQDRVFDLLGQAVFGAHPLGRAVIGTAAVVGAVTQEQLRTFHDERYSPPQIVIAAAGSLDHDALVALARDAGPGGGDGGGAGGGGDDGPESATAAISARGADAPVLADRETRTAQARASVPAQPEPEFERRVRFLRKDTEQYHLCLGGRGISRHDERRFALRVLEGVLGGTSSSRLFQEVRERRGLAYSVFSFSSLYAHTGEVGLYVGTRPDNLSEAVATIAAELERVLEDPASPQELDRSRENLKGRVALSLESTTARMNRLGSALLGETPIYSVDEIVDRIDAVTVDDLRELARELFAPDTLSAAAVGAEEGAFLHALAPLQKVAA